MSAAKRLLQEAWDKESKEMEGKCWTCGKELVEEDDQVRDGECFQCYVDRQD
jgi:hypothetical protein